MINIAIVEDEVIAANYLKRLLELEGYKIAGLFRDAKSVIDAVQDGGIDLILMDIVLQGYMLGSEAAIKIYEIEPSIAIIFLTAYGEQEMIDSAVRSRALSYLLKPYRDSEILAALQLATARLDRSHPNQTDTIELIEHYSFSKSTQMLYQNNKEVPLGPKALKLIRLLCEHKNRTIEIDEIIQSLYGDEDSVSTQTLRSLIHRIRENTTHNLIQNVSRFGYKIGTK